MRSFPHPPRRQNRARPAVFLFLFILLLSAPACAEESVLSRLLSLDLRSGVLATGGPNGELRLWEASSGELQEYVSGASGDVLALRLSPGADLVAWTDGKTVRLWSVKSRRLIREFPGAQDLLRTLDLSPDGQRLAAAGDDMVLHVWDVRTGERIWEGGGTHRKPVKAVRFSPDGRILASAGDDGLIALSDARSGQTLRVWTASGDWIRDLAFNDDGTRLASCGDDRYVRLWSVPGGQEQQTFGPLPQALIAIALSPGGQRWAAGGLRGGLWIAQNQAEEPGGQKPLLTLRGHEAAVNALTFTGVGGSSLVSASDDGTIRLWRVADGLRAGQIGSAFHQEPLPTLDPFPSPDRGIRTLQPLPRGGLLSLDRSGRLMIRSGDGSPVLRREGIRAASASLSGTVFWVDEEGQLVPVRGGRPGPGVSPWPKERPVSLAAAKDGSSVLVGGSQGGLGLWDPDSGSFSAWKSPHESPITVLLEAPGGGWACATALGSVSLWTKDGTLRRALEGQGASVVSLAFHPESEMLGVGSADLLIRIWDLASWEQVRTLSQETALPLGISFSPDGRLLLATDGPDLRIWNWILEKPIRGLAFQTPGLTAMTALDGERYRLGGIDGTLHSFDLATGEYSVWSFPE